MDAQARLGDLAKEAADSGGRAAHPATASATRRATRALDGCGALRTGDRGRGRAGAIAAVFEVD
jgi:hypothetical protein